MSQTLNAARLKAHIATVDAKLATFDPEKVAEIDRELTVDVEEHFRFQQCQASAHARGWLTPEAAQIVYIALGEQGSEKNGGWAAETDTATKYSVTQLIGELLERTIRGRSK